MSDCNRGTSQARTSTRRIAATMLLDAVGGYVVVSLVMLGLGTLLTHVLLHGGLGRWDDHVSRWFSAHRIRAVDDVTAALTRLANTSGIVVVAAITEVVLFVRRRVREAFLLLVGLPIELASFLTVNYLVDRPRPAVPRLGSLPSTSSFPSGHVAATLALYTLIAVCISRLTRTAALHGLAWSLAVALPVLVAFARVYRGMHHVTDVVGGALLGIGATITARVAVALPPVEAEGVESTATRTPPATRATTRERMAAEGA